MTDLLQHVSALFGGGRNEEMASFDLRAREEQEQQKRERDRTARLTAYLQCRESGRDDCRMDISWEEMAQAANS